jgi:hypothetical protein
LPKSTTTEPLKLKLVSGVPSALKRETTKSGPDGPLPPSCEHSRIFPSACTTGLAGSWNCAAVRPDTPKPPLPKPGSRSPSVAAAELHRTKAAAMAARPADADRVPVQRGE